jgi:peptide/nickel transport system permease protein
MFRMFLQRVGLGVITVFLVSAMIFTAVEILPGDACTAILQRDAVGQRLENCRQELGLNRPAIIRYSTWAIQVLKGDLGTSIHNGKQIADLVFERFKNTMLLATLTLMLGVPLAIGLGILTALRRDRLPDVVVSTLAIFAMTIPEFVSATLLIFIFSIWLGWVPGIVTASASAPLSSFFPGIILPVVVMTMVMTAHILRAVRSNVIEVMESDYIQMAVLKGVPYRTIILRHALPNALLPAINVIALTIAWLLGGVVVVEKVFNFPGLGHYMVDAISDRDLPVVQAIALIVATVYVGVNLAADLLGLLLNPRLRTMRTRA